MDGEKVEAEVACGALSSAGGRKGAERLVQRRSEIKRRFIYTHTYLKEEIVFSLQIKKIIIRDFWRIQSRSRLTLSIHSSFLICLPPPN